MTDHMVRSLTGSCPDEQRVDTFVRPKWKIVNHGSALCLARSTYPGDLRVYQQDYRGFGRQHWAFFEVEGSPEYFRISDVTGAVITIDKDHRSENGAAAILDWWRGDDDFHMQWKLRATNSPEVYVLVSRHSNKILEVDQNNLHSPDARIQQWDPTSSSNQAWVFLQAPNEPALKAGTT